MVNNNKKQNDYSKDFTLICYKHLNRFIINTEYYETKVKDLSFNTFIAPEIDIILTRKQVSFCYLINCTTSIVTGIAV